MDGVGSAFEMTLCEVFVEDLLGGVLLGGGGHGEDAYGFLDDHEVFVLIDNLHVLVLQLCRLLVLAHTHDLSRVQGLIVAGGVTTIHGDAVASEDVLGTVARDTAEFLHQEFQEGGLLADDQFVVFRGGIFSAGKILHIIRDDRVRRAGWYVRGRAVQQIGRG